MPAPRVSLEVGVVANANKYDREMRRTQRATQRTTRDLNRASRGFRNMEIRSRATENALRRFATRLAALGVAFYGFTRAITGTVNTLNSLQDAANALRVVTDSQAELIQVQGELLDVAQRARTPWLDLVTIYRRLAIATNEQGVSSTRLVRIIETLSKAAIASGTNMQELRAGLIQLSQGLGAGALRGDEFRSVMENLPAVARAIAAGIGVTVGELRTLSQEGKLTTEVIVQALEDAEEGIEDLFSNVEVTIKQASNILSNETLAIVQNLDRISNASGITAASIRSVAKAAGLIRGGLEGVESAGQTVRPSVFSSERYEFIGEYLGILFRPVIVPLEGAAEGLEKAVQTIPDTDIERQQFRFNLLNELYGTGAFKRFVNDRSGGDASGRQDPIYRLTGEVPPEYANLDGATLSLNRQLALQTLGLEQLINKQFRDDVEQLENALDISKYQDRTGIEIGDPLVEYFEDTAEIERVLKSARERLAESDKIIEDHYNELLTLQIALNNRLTTEIQTQKEIADYAKLFEEDGRSIFSVDGYQALLDAAGKENKQRLEEEEKKRQEEAEKFRAQVREDSRTRTRRFGTDEAAILERGQLDALNTLVSQNEQAALQRTAPARRSEYDPLSSIIADDTPLLLGVMRDNLEASAEATLEMERAAEAFKQSMQEVGRTISGDLVRGLRESADAAEILRNITNRLLDQLFEAAIVNPLGDLFSLGLSTLGGQFGILGFGGGASSIFNTAASIPNQFSGIGSGYGYSAASTTVAQAVGARGTTINVNGVQDPSIVRREIQRALPEIAAATTANTIASTRRPGVVRNTLG